MPHPMRSELNRGTEAERDSRGAEFLKEGHGFRCMGMNSLGREKAFQEWEQHKEVHAIT